MRGRHAGREPGRGFAGDHRRQGRYHYWRERLIYHKGEEDEHEVSYGKARVKDETVIVKAKPLATTGIAVGGVAGLSALLALGGCGLALSKRRRPRGQHAA